MYLRIPIGSLEPWDFPDRFIDLWDNPRMCPHLHLPLQSGSNKVLAADDPSMFCGKL